MKRILLFIALLATTITIGCKASTNNEDSGSTAGRKYLAVKLNDSELWSILDLKNKKVLYKNKFSDAPEILNNELFFKKKSDGLQYIYSITNPEIVLNKKGYKKLLLPSSKSPNDPIIALNQEGQLLLLDHTGKEFATLDASISACAPFENGLAVFGIDDKLGYINKLGKIVIKPILEVALPFSDGVAVGKRSVFAFNPDAPYADKYTGADIYAFDAQGRELFRFDSEGKSVGPFQEGFIPIIKGTAIWYLNKKGEEVYKLCGIGSWLEADSGPSVGQLLDICSMNEGRSVFTENRLFGLKDKNNRVLIPAKYRQLFFLGNGVYTFKREQNGFMGLIDYNGNVIVECKYLRISYCAPDVYVAYEEDDSLLLINGKGENIFPSINISQIAVTLGNFIAK